MSSPFVCDLHPPKGRLQRGLGLCVLDGGLTEAGESSKELVRQWVEAVSLAMCPLLLAR